MIISHKLKYVFIHVPKTGGTSMKQILYSKRFQYDEQGWTIETRSGGKINQKLSTHASAKEVIDYLIRNNYDPNKYFKFCFIRNPWDMVVSNFEYYKQYMSKIPYLNDREKEKVSVAEQGFSQFVKHNNTELWWTERIFTNNKLDVDYVGTFENIDEASQIIFKKILGDNYTPINFPHVNSTVRRDYRDYYDEETKNLVEKRYLKIIQLGGYTF